MVSDQHFEGIGGAAIHVEYSESVVIERCTFADVGTAIRLVECSNIVVRDCAFYNITGGPPGQSEVVGNFVQLDKCTQAVVEDCWGIIDPTTGGNSEDLVSVYKSDHVLVTRNRFYGCGPSMSGSGIALGDRGGDHNTAEANVLVNCGQVGVFIAGGVGNTIRRNIIINTGWQNSNVGIAVWRSAGSDSCGSHTVEGNRVRWHRPDGSRNPRWTSGACGPIAGWDDNTWHDTSLTPAVWATTPT